MFLLVNSYKIRNYYMLESIINYINFMLTINSRNYVNSIYMMEITDMLEVFMKSFVYLIQ